MLNCCNRSTLSLIFGCLVFLMVTPVVNTDGRVFVLDLRNSSNHQGFRDAERACASRHARLASSAELRHAVVECLFSHCTRGWLYGGTVGTTVCNVVGSALKAVDVKIENATDDTTNLDAFCIKDKGVPCGDPPSFPNARLQGHSGYEMGDELLYTCVPGYVMPSGHSAFSLLCDSCGEWYGLVEICVKDETESHVDYEDKFTDSYGETEPHSERPEEVHGEMHEKVHGGANLEEKRIQEQQETSFSVEAGEEHQDQHGEHDIEGEVISLKPEGAVGEEKKDKEQAVEDFIGHPKWEQERKVDAATATEAPVSLLSQKHLFWFPSEAFQDEGHPVSTNPTTQRASGAQSEESKEHESQERQHHQYPFDNDDRDHEPDTDDDHDTDEQKGRDESNHDNLDAHNGSHYDDLDDRDSHQDEGDLDVKHYFPHQHDDLDRKDRHHDDHYDMGEHEEDHDRVHYGSHDYDDRDDTYDEHESFEDHEDVTDDHGDDDDGEHPDSSKEHPDHDDHNVDEEHHDLEENDNDRYTDHDDHDHHEHDDHDSYDDHDSHEDVDDGHQHVIFSIAREGHQNITQKGKGEKATTDETWLDGYPVIPEETENGDSTTDRVDRPNEVEIRGPAPYTSSPEVYQSPTMEPAIKQGGVEKMWPGSVLTAVPSPDRSQPSDPPSYSDTLDYDTQQAAPTDSWLGDITEHPFLNHDPAPPVHGGDVLIEEHAVNNLPGEIGERGEMEGEIGETICTGENCPPPSSSSRGPTVAAIIVLVCLVAVAVIVGVWCYRRQQQKSSVYEMNGKGQSQIRQGQQIEMQQKV